MKLVWMKDKKVERQKFDGSLKKLLERIAEISEKNVLRRYLLIKENSVDEESLREIFDIACNIYCLNEKLGGKKILAIDAVIGNEQNFTITNLETKETIRVIVPNCIYVRDLNDKNKIYVAMKEFDSMNFSDLKKKLDKVIAARKWLMQQWVKDESFEERLYNYWYLVFQDGYIEEEFFEFPMVRKAIRENNNDELQKVIKTIEQLKEDIEKEYSGINIKEVKDLFDEALFSLSQKSYTIFRDAMYKIVHNVDLDKFLIKYLTF